MRIQHNIMAMNAYRNYTNNVSAMKKNLEKLSSGYKINRAGDDAAGLAISEKMRAQITGLETAQKNAKDGISLVQTAEGALTEVHDMLNRMVELATQSANGTYDNTTDRFQLQKEMDQLRTEINRIADSANFNGIKLFDGSLSGADITTTGIETSQIDMASGVTVEQGGVGGGSKGEYTFDITSPFGAGDTIKFDFGGKIADAGGTNLPSYTLTYGATTDGFKGETAEQQALSIASALSTKVGSDFSVTADGTTIKLVSSTEGNDATKVSTVTNATVTNKTAKPDATWAKTDGVVADVQGASTFALLFNKADGSGPDIPKGSTISFEVTMSGTNNKMKVSLTEGTDFTVGQTIDETVDSVVAALKAKNFEDNANTTALDESKISVADMFDVASDGAGGITFTNKTNSVAAGGIVFTGPNGNTVTSTAGTAVDPTNAAASSYLLKLDATNGAGNISIGDKLSIKGQLADGRYFKVDVEAGKDFKVDENATAATAFTSTMANLETLLETKGTKVQITDKDGNATGETIDSTEIFGTAANGKEIDFNTTTAATFTSNRTGTTLVSQVTDVVLTAGKDSNVSKNLNNGAQQSAASSTVTFGEGLSYGATVEVGGQKYEIVRKADDISGKKNVAVVVDDISDANAVAKAMGEALEGELSKSAYEVSVSGSKVTVSTTDVGSNAKAVTMSASGEKTTQTEFTLDPEKMQAGATVTINGQTYEFVNKGGKTTSAGNTKIEVNDIAKSTAKELGDALAASANGVKNAYVGVDNDGKVTVRGLADVKGTVTTPTVKFDGGKGGLTLQIGDTAEDFNKMTVSIYNMHTADMGIGDVSIADQESAAAAIDKIKAAINYVSDVRGTLGATQNRLDHTINNLSVMTENIQDAESTIRDTDVASEMMAYTKNNILIQSAQAMLAQANQVPQGVLQLLQ